MTSCPEAIESITNRTSKKDTPWGVMSKRLKSHLPGLSPDEEKGRAVQQCTFRSSHIGNNSPEHQ
ncbi:MAG: hypothetical protein FIB07_01700 [Candidatus Methanoperedens sp.]|nr:hypothetical protein [Candidatus Methanoperedens sp.]